MLNRGFAVEKYLPRGMDKTQNGVVCSILSELYSITSTVNMKPEVFLWKLRNVDLLPLIGSAEYIFQPLTNKQIL